MSEFWYDGQLKRYLTQFMRIMSNFSWQDGYGVQKQIPVRYGDMNRQVAQIMKKNSENVVQSAPFIACYIKDLEYDRTRLQDPTFVGKMHIRERAYDAQGQEYLNVQGANYTVERIMPSPYIMKLTADIWTTNVDQKLQIIEQLAAIFNPAIEIQTSNNFVDWTSLSYVELVDTKFSSRQIPAGLEQDIDIATYNFTTPVLISAPAKVKKLGIITKIISSIFDESPDITFGEMDALGGNPISVTVTTLGDLSIMILNNTATLIQPDNIHSNINSDPIAAPVNFGTNPSWVSILDLYPGKFTAGLSQVRMTKPDGNEIVGFISLDPIDDTIMHINFDSDTVPMNTLLVDMNTLNPRGTIDAIVNPQSFNPRPIQLNGSLGWPASDTRYLILEDISYDVKAWENQDGSPFLAKANDIIQWDGSKWNIIFDSITDTSSIYITNSRTGIQYTWNGTSWLKSFEGVYDPGQWRLIL